VHGECRLRRGSSIGPGNLSSIADGENWEIVEEERVVVVDIEDDDCVRLIDTRIFDIEMPLLCL
jgi:hypothetical protein